MAEGSNNEDGDSNFISRLFGKQVDRRQKPDISDVAPVEEIDKNTNKPTDPMTDVEPGRIFGQSLTGNEWQRPQIKEPQAVEAPLKTRPITTMRSQAIHRRNIGAGRRKIIAGLAGLAGTAIGVGAIKTGEAVANVIINASDQATAARMQQERNDEESRRKLDAQRGIPHKSNAQIMEELKNKP